MKRSKENRCNNCHELIDNCNCQFDFIPDVPLFVKKRSLLIQKQREKEIFTINRVIIMINLVFDRMPRLYFTRSGCEIEEFDEQFHSDHDAVRNIGSLMISEYNELLIDLSTGCYNSAIRCVRSNFEWLIRTIAIVSDRSIFTNRNEDKNKSYCFACLSRMMSISQKKKKMNSEEKQELKDTITALSLISNMNENEHELNFLKSNIPFGIGKIPEQLNDLILKNLMIKDPVSGQVFARDTALYQIYDVMSQHVHTDLEKLFTLNPGGVTKFLNLDEFDKAYSVIMTAIDVVFYLFLILIDIDVFHGDAERRKKWHKHARVIFNGARFGKKEFVATKSLLNSSEWTTKTPPEFACHP